MKSSIIAALILSLLALMVTVTGLLSQQITDRLQLFLWAGVAFLAGLLNLFLGPRWLDSLVFSHLVSVEAALQASWLIGFTGGWRSPYLALYLLTPLAATLYRPSWSAALAAGACSAITHTLLCGWPPPEPGMATIQTGLMALAATMIALIAGQNTIHRRLLQVSRRIALVASVAFDLERLLDDVFQALSGAARVSSAYILILQQVDGRDSLLCRAAVGSTDSQHIPAIPVGQGVTGRVAQTAQTIYLPDVRRQSSYLNVNPATRSELAIPLPGNTL